MSVIKAGLFLAWLVTAALLFISNAAAMLPQDIPEGLEDAARTGLPRFLHAIAQDDPGRFTFASLEEIERAELGEPFQVFTIPPRDILDYDGRAPVSSLIQPADIWFFPVLVDDDIKTLLTVEQSHGTWKAVAIGSSNLARQWFDIVKTYPRIQGYEPSFVRVYQAAADFVLLDRSPEPQAAVPLRSTSIVLGLAEDEPQTPSDLLLKMQDTVRKSLEQEGILR